MNNINSCIFYGKVVHQRLRPRSHKLDYRVFSLLIDLDELEILNKNYKLLSYNRSTFYSIRDADHGYGNSIYEWVCNELTAEGYSDCNKKILMLCYPRIFGYAFNPITVFFCYREDKKLGAIIYEVHNTFNERHCYVLPVNGEEGEIIKQECEKDFYVSPFIPENCKYKFLVKPPGKKISIVINDSDEQGLLLIASFTGNRGPLNDKALLKTTFLYPLMSLKVILGIHYEALKLWLKRAPFFAHEPYTNQNLNTSKSLRKYRK